MELKGILRTPVKEALRFGADYLEIEYKDGYELVFVMRSGIGCGIARFESSTPEASALRKGLYSLARKKRRMVLDDPQCELRVHTYDSFGETAFRIRLRRI